MYVTPTKRELLKKRLIKNKNYLIYSAVSIITVVLAVKASERSVNGEHKKLRDEMGDGNFVIPLKDNRYVVLPVMRDSRYTE